MIKVKAQGSTEWLVWDTKDVEYGGLVVAVHIHKCFDYHMGQSRKFYRVDKAGVTFETSIWTKAEAVEAAKRALRYVRK